MIVQDVINHRVSFRFLLKMDEYTKISLGYIKPEKMGHSLSSVCQMVFSENPSLSNFSCDKPDLEVVPGPLIDLLSPRFA